MYTRLTRLIVVFGGSGAFLSVLANMLHGVRSGKLVPTSVVIEELPLSVREPMKTHEKKSGDSTKKSEILFFFPSNPFSIKGTGLSFFFFSLQLYLQFQHLHYLHYYYTNLYSYNILANFTTYTYTTYTCTTVHKSLRY